MIHLRVQYRHVQARTGTSAQGGMRVHQDGMQRECTKRALVYIVVHKTPFAFKCIIPTLRTYRNTNNYLRTCRKSLDNSKTSLSKTVPTKQKNALPLPWHVMHMHTLRCELSVCLCAKGLYFSALLAPQCSDYCSP